MRFAFDLWSHDDVGEHADAILDRLQAGTMPCDGAWPEERVEVFNAGWTLARPRRRKELRNVRNDRHLESRQPQRVLVLASNPAVSEQTGWPIGFWWSELTHPYWEFVEHGYEVDVASPDGGPLQGDSWSDPRDRAATPPTT